MTDTQSRGVLLGLAAVISWAVYNIGASMGRAQGFTSSDLTLLRYAGGACALAPLMWLQGSKFSGLTLRRLLLLILFAGPPFALVITVGFAMAPLSHAVVISPGIAMLTATFLGVALNHESISASRILGMAILVLGLVLVAIKPGVLSSLLTNWRGDLCFVASGTLWGFLTFSISRWRLDPVAATGAIACVSTLLFLPHYLLFAQPAPVPAKLWLLQFFLQGILGGGLAIVFYMASIRILGASNAGLFPALVPVVSVILAIPISGSWPAMIETIGIGCAFAGTVIAMRSHIRSTAFQEDEKLPHGSKQRVSRS